MTVNGSLSSLSNPLVTIQQLQSAFSGADDISADLEKSLRYFGALLTQAAGILLKLPQDIIAQAIITLARFCAALEAGSRPNHSLKDISAASLYLTAKLSFHPQTTRALLNVYAYLTSNVSPIFNNSEEPNSKSRDPTEYTISEGEYLSARQKLFHYESLILRTLSYNTHVVLPHSLALTYLQTLGLLPPAPTKDSHDLAAQTIALLNSALLSPQLLCLTHQPNALATAAIYLAARQTNTKLAEGQWWCVWDVGREELGFLVMSLGSLQGFVEQEHAYWKDRRLPWTSEHLKDELREREGELGERQLIPSSKS